MCNFNQGTKQNKPEMESVSVNYKLILNLQSKNRL